MKNRWMVLVLTGMLGALVLTSCSLLKSRFTEAKAEDIQTGGFTVAASCHDPEIVEADGTYYMFGSHMVGAVSTDLRDWEYFANGVDGSNKLFDNLFTFILYVFAHCSQRHRSTTLGLIMPL